MDVSVIDALTGLLPPIALSVCAVLFFRGWRSGSLQTRSFTRAIGWLALCALPAVAAQILYTATRGAPGDALMFLLTAPFAWWVLLGGGSVIAFFEASAKNMSGHRESTLMDNLPYFGFLTALQLAFLATAVSLRLKEGRELRDPVILGAGGFVLVNSLVAIGWPWWGT